MRTVLQRISLIFHSSHHFAWEIRIPEAKLGNHTLKLTAYKLQT